MEQTNEPGPAQGDKRIEEKVHSDYDTMYADLLKKEQEAENAKMRGEAIANYENVRKLGFATMKDIEEKIGATIGKYQEEVKALRDENAKLSEWVMRAKAQGLNSGATDDKKQENPLKHHERTKWH